MYIRRFCLLVILPFTLFTSCSKDEPDTSFSGTWLLQATEKKNCTDSSNNSSKDDNFISNAPCEARFGCIYEQYVFSETTFDKNSSGALFGIPFSGTKEGEYTLSGSSLTLCEERISGTIDCETLEYSISGKTMTLTGVNSNTGCTEIRYYRKQ